MVRRLGQEEREAAEQAAQRQAVQQALQTLAAEAAQENRAAVQGPEAVVVADYCKVLFQ
jgi:hypothetical protein